MIFFITCMWDNWSQSAKNLINKKFSIKKEATSLEEILSNITEQTGIQFSIFIKKPIAFSVINISNRTIKSFLEDLLSAYHFHITYKDNTIVIQECEEKWITYKIPALGGSPYDFPGLNSYDSHNNKESTSYFETIEKVISKITNNLYAIDKYQHLVTCKGDCRVHKNVVEYLNHLDIKCYINIELCIIEFSLEKEDISIINKIINTLNGLPNVDNIMSSMSDICGPNIVYLNASNSIFIQVIPHCFANITSTRQISYQMTESSISRSSVQKNFKYTPLDDGISLSFLATCKNKDMIMLELKAVVQSILNKKKAPEVNYQKLSTIMLVENNKPIIIGGLKTKTRVSKIFSSRRNEMSIIMKFLKWCNKIGFSSNKVKDVIILIFIKPKIVYI